MPLCTGVVTGEVSPHRSGVFPSRSPTRFQGSRMPLVSADYRPISITPPSSYLGTYPPAHSRLDGYHLLKGQCPDHGVARSFPWLNLTAYCLMAADSWIC